MQLRPTCNPVAMPILVNEVGCLELSEDNIAVAGDVIFLDVQEEAIPTKLFSIKKIKSSYNQKGKLNDILNILNFESFNVDNKSAYL